MSIEDSSSNTRKVKAGTKFDQSIKEKLSELVESGIIAEFDCRVNVSHRNYSYKRQYLANFIIKTCDDKYIVVRRTTSFRHDRAKIAFYDLIGIQRHSDYAPSIIASIFLVPDIASAEIEYIHEKERVYKNESFSPATHYFSLTEFFDFLNDYALDVISEKDQMESSAADLGSLLGKRGHKFETELSELLSNPDHLDALKDNPKNCNLHYAVILNTILGDDDEVSVENVFRVEATTTIPLLASGGMPKTDIAVTIFLPQKTIVATISAKYTNKEWVTCHDYTAEKFVEVLACIEKPLAAYLTLFQDYPTYKDFGNALPKGASEEEFEDLLGPEERKLSEWAITGSHDTENLINPELQVAEYCVLYNDESLAIHSSEEYIDIMMDKGKKKFGVPFRWTYPSKQRGSRIQLKMPVFRD